MEVYNLVHDTNIKSYNNIVIGHETCAYAFIKCMHNFDIEKFNNMNIRVVTPMIPENLTRKTFNIIHEISRKKTVKVVFNDIGFLYMCRKLIINHRIIPVIGRILTHSFFDCPWSSEIIKHEDNDVKLAFNQFFCSDENKRKIFQEYGVEELEVNYCEGNVMHNLKKNEFEITTYNSNKLLSVGRICFSARFFQLPFPNCYESKVCDKEIYLNVVKKWGKNRIINGEMSEKDKIYFKDNYLIGNAVYQKIDISKKSEVELYDNIILDGR